MQKPEQDFQKQMQRDIQQAIGKQTIYQLKKGNQSMSKKFESLFFNKHNLTQMLRVLRLTNMHDYVKKRQANLLALAGIVKGGGLIIVAWKVKQLYNKLLFGLIFLSFSNFFADHWIMKRAIRNVCLENLFNQSQQQHRNLFQFYFPTDSKIQQIRKLSQSFYAFQKNKS